MSKSYLTAESVCAGHPDKLCDFIADSILDECLKFDPSSRVACEVLATKGHIVVAGEITCSVDIDFHLIVEEALKSRSYNAKDFIIDVYLHTQSADIASGVNNALEIRDGKELLSTLGAGDQGTVYGYATNETEEFLPLPLVLAHDLCKQVDKVRHEDIIIGLYPDGKAQVTIEYNGIFPVRVKTIVLSIQHDKDKDLRTLQTEIYNKVFKPVFTKFPFDEDTEIYINPSGRFVEGGPSADTGLTGRKIMVDTYGGLAFHGGGAFSGKDATKVDRSGAYFARYIAKNIVASGLASKCEVAISYAIGKADPVAISVNTFKTGEYTDDMITSIVNRIFSARPASIIELFKLTKPIYKKTSAYGHFNDETFPWEKVEQVSKLQSEVIDYVEKTCEGQKQI